MSSGDRDASLTQNDLRAILTRYVEAEEATLLAIVNDIDAVTMRDDAARRLARERQLREIEMHARADALVEEAVAKYREDLYFVSRRLSEEEGDSAVITENRVRQAQAALSRNRKGYSWSDWVITIGGLFAGAGLPQLLQGKAPNLYETIFAVLGALLLGIGLTSKAR